jgi:hypothetical protein
MASNKEPYHTTRFPGHKCDLADMDGADRNCPKCGNEMYTDGTVDFCGYCFTELNRYSEKEIACVRIVVTPTIWETMFYLKKPEESYNDVIIRLLKDHDEITVMKRHKKDGE